MPRAKKEDVFPNYIRVKDTDQETLAELTLRAKGGRSLSEFARACGVNPSTLSRLVNQKNSGPCADTLIKAIADNADPDSGVTLDMLLEAHGLAAVVVQSPQLPEGLLAAMEEAQRIMKAAVPAEGVQGAVAALEETGKAVRAARPQGVDAIQSAMSSLANIMDSYQTVVKAMENVDIEAIGRMQREAERNADAVQSALEAASETQRIVEEYDKARSQGRFFTPSEVLIQIDEMQGDAGNQGSGKMIRKAANIVRAEAFDRDAGDIISGILLRKGYAVRMEMEPERGKFDFAIETDALQNQGINKWFFEVKSGHYSGGIRFLDKLFQDLYFNSMYDEGKAVSLVIGDKQAFEGIREKYWKTRIHDYVSVILVDRINRCVAEEFVFPQKGKQEKVVSGVFK